MAEWAIINKIIPVLLVDTQLPDLENVHCYLIQTDGHWKSNKERELELAEWDTWKQSQEYIKTKSKDLPNDLFLLFKSPINYCISIILNIIKDLIMSCKLAPKAFNWHQIMLSITFLERIGYHVYTSMIYGNNLWLCWSHCSNDRQNLKKNKSVGWLSWGRYISQVTG